MRRLLTGVAGVVLAGSLFLALLELSGVDLAALAAPSQEYYAVTESTGTIVPGTQDVGNHCNNCLTQVFLPFEYQLYDRTFTVTRASSNGNSQFTSFSAESANGPLPRNDFGYTIFPYWDDLDTSLTGTGIFTSISGTAPNRIFNIEWRAREMNTQFSPTSNFELQLYEGQTRFDVVYGQTGSNGASATAGVQKNDFIFTPTSTQYSFNQPLLTNGKRLIFTLRTPTAAIVRALSATASRRGIVVRWRTASEVDLLGFNVWRTSGDGKPRRVNGALVVPKGGGLGSRYSFVDRTARPGRTYAYRLQIVRISGASAWSPSVTARAVPVSQGG